MRDRGKETDWSLGPLGRKKGEDLLSLAESSLALLWDSQILMFIGTLVGRKGDSPFAHTSSKWDRPFGIGT